jgi:phytol kinase
MLAVIVCSAGVLAILMVAEWFFRSRILVGENLRKFVHITLGGFVASWPWLISWGAIQLLGLVMLAGVFASRYKKELFDFSKSVHRADYGDIFFVMAVLACSILTSNNVFFAVAMLEIALADGLAAIVGKKYGRYWRYKVFGRTKTVLGSMVFWFTSVCILGTGLLLANDLINFQHYVALVILLPPLLTVLENVSVRGLDNITVPTALLIILRLTTSS